MFVSSTLRAPPLASLAKLVDEQAEIDTKESTMCGAAETESAPPKVKPAEVTEQPSIAACASVTFELNTVTAPPTARPPKELNVVAVQFEIDRLTSDAFDEVM
jgi:hypothetical protein